MAREKVIKKWKTALEGKMATFIKREYATQSISITKQEIWDIYHDMKDNGHPALQALPEEYFGKKWMAKFI